MNYKIQPLVVGNWKLNPITLADAKALFVGVRKAAQRYKEQVAVVAAPPFPYLADAVRLSPSQTVAVAAQDVFYESKGAYTGEVSPTMLATLGVQYVIIGHSERRALGETNDDVAKKVVAALQAKLKPIVCIGEQKRDTHGSFYEFIETQLQAVTAAIPASRLKDITIAYEPIWAIGTGDTATAEDVEEMQLFIRKTIAKQVGRTKAKRVRVLYGGSVKPANAHELYHKGHVDGFLVGGASLQAADFTEIIKATIS